MSIFKDDKERLGLSDKRSVEESNYTYLNSSLLDRNEEIRKKFNRLFDLYQHDDGERNKILTQIRSKDDVGYYSASFELIVNAILKKLGFHVQVHPDLDNESGKHPDFLVTAPNGEKFYLELVTSIENNDTHINRLKEKLKKLQVPDSGYILNNDIIGRIQSSKTIDEIIKRVKTWLTKEDKSYITTPFLYEEQNFTLTISAIYSSSIVTSSQIITDLALDDKMLKSLESKASRYGQLDYPYVIAISLRPSDFSLDFSKIINKNSINLIERALFGKPCFTNPERYEKGFWYYLEKENQSLKFRNENVVAVWYFDELTVERLDQEVDNTLYLSSHNSVDYPISLIQVVNIKYIHSFNHVGIEFATYKDHINLYDIF